MEQLTDSQLEQWSTEVNHLKSLRWDACARWSIIGVMISVFVVFVWGLVRYDVICCTLFDPQLILWVAFCVMFRSVQYPRSYCFRPLETICFYFSDIYVFIFVLLLPQLDWVSRFPLFYASLYLALPFGSLRGAIWFCLFGLVRNPFFRDLRTSLILPDISYHIKYLCPSDDSSSIIQTIHPQVDVKRLHE